jgi:hypothetical protein
VISLDFSKAFDTVSHCKLLHKPSKCGLSDSMLRWFKNFCLAGSSVLKWVRVCLDGYMCSVAYHKARCVGHFCLTCMLMIARMCVRLRYNTVC